MKLMLEKSHFLEMMPLRDGELDVSALSRKDITLRQVTYPIRPLVPRDVAGNGSVAEQVWNLLYRPEVRRGDDDLLSTEDALTYIRKIQRFVQAGEPIHLVFIGFPFKAYFNPLKTNRHLPDLGEFYFLRRLLEMNATVQQVYPPGLVWTILTEGEAYRDLVGVPAAEASAYQQTIQKFVGYLGASDTIILDSLKRLYASYPCFEVEVGKLENNFKLQYGSDPSSLPPEFHTMLWTMRQSVDIGHCSAEELYYLAADEFPICAPLEAQKLWQQVLVQAVGITCRYLAINQTKNTMGTSGGGVVEEAFPDACYVSITPKRGRYAFHAVSQHSRFMAHHGVPLLMGKRNGYVRVIYLADILSKPNRFRAVYVQEDTEDKPFFYQQVESNGNRQTRGGWE